MKIDIALINKGIIGQAINGFVEADMSKPKNIKSVRVVFRTKTIYPEYKSGTPADPTESGNVSLWANSLQEDIGFQTAETVCFSEHYCFEDNRFTEYPPGIARFPFELLLPDTCCNTVQMGKCGLKWEMVAVITEDGGKTHNSQPIECPLLFTERTINEPTRIETEKDHPKYNIKLVVDKRQVKQGDILNGKIVFTNKMGINLDLNITCESVLEALTNDNCAMDKRVFSQCVKQVGSGITTLNVCIPVSINQLPTVIAPPFTIKNYVVVKVGTTTFSSASESGVFLPIEVFAIPMNRKNMVEYAQSIGYSNLTFKKKNFYGSHKISPPKVDFKDGIEQVKEIDSNFVYYLDHLKRVVYSDLETKKISDKIYPVELGMLPDGWSFGYFRNERYFVDARTNETTWNDPREKPLPEHVVEGVTGTLSITPLRTESVGIGKGLEVVVMVGKNKLKSAICKGIDCTFERNPLRFNIDSQRNNVMIYIYENKDLVGVVELDLTLMKHYTNIRKWYYLHPVEHQRTEFMGKIEFEIIYATACDKPQLQDTFDYISKTNWYFFPPTSKFISYVNTVNEIRTKEQKKPLVVVHDGRYIVLNRESYFSYFQVDEASEEGFAVIKKKSGKSGKPYKRNSTTIRAEQLSVIPCDATFTPIVEKPKKRFSLSLSRSRSSSRGKESDGEETKKEGKLVRSLSTQGSKSRGSSKEREEKEKETKETKEVLISPQTRSRSRSLSANSKANGKEEVKKTEFVVDTKKRKGPVTVSNLLGQQEPPAPPPQNEGIILD